MKKISFVILTWNSEKYIANCLNSVLEISDYNVDIYIADNGSNDSTITIIKELQEKHNNIYLKELEKNYGTTISRNILLKDIQQTDYIGIIDSDTVVNSNSISKLIDVLESNENVGIVGPTLVTSNGVVQNSGRNLPTLKEKLLKAIPITKIQKIAEKYEIVSENSKIKKVGYLMSACWLMRNDFFNENGFLDERIFYAPEDSEYCTRAWKNGYCVLYVEDAVIIHEWQRLSKKKYFSKINLEHIKGLLYYWKKYNIAEINNIIRGYKL